MALAYAIGIPSLYLVLSDKRKEKFTGYHGVQAMFLWIALIVIWTVIRTFEDLILNLIYIPFLDPLIVLLGSALWLYAIYLSIRAYRGEYFTIPYVSDLIKRVQ